MKQVNTDFTDALTALLTAHSKSLLGHAHMIQLEYVPKHVSKVNMVLLKRILHAFDMKVMYLNISD